jgi:hypothetical protein
MSSEQAVEPLNNEFFDGPDLARRADTAERRSYRYLVIGLMRNEHALLDSTLALLSSRFAHAWSVVPSGQPRELTLLGSEATLLEESEARRTGRVIWVGGNPRDRAEHVSFPLRPLQLLRVFDEAGAKIDAAREERSREKRLMSQEAMLALDGHDLDHIWHGKFKLLHWPEQAMIDHGEHFLALASLMTYRPSSLADLVQGSRLSPHLCHEFLETMIRHGFAGRVVHGKLAQTTVQVATDEPRKAGGGLLGFVRALRG